MERVDFPHQLARVQRRMADEHHPYAQARGGKHRHSSIISATQNIVQSIILAAGMGKRPGELTKNNTKCMVQVNGATLTERLRMREKAVD